MGADETELERVCDAGDDLVLQRKHIRPLAVETFRPEMTGGRAVDQLRVDAHVVADPTYRALQHVPDTKRCGDLCGFSLLALVGGSRVSRDDEQARYACKFCRQVLGETVSQITLRRVIAEIVKWKHDEGWPGVGFRIGRQSGGAKPVAPTVATMLLQGRLR